MAVYPNAVWMRGYVHQSGYNLVVAPAACWVLIVVNGGASHCGHVGSESYQIYLSDVQLVHTLISTPCATSPYWSMLCGSTDSASILFGCATGDAQSCESLATRCPGGALRPLGVRETGPS